VGQVSRFRQRVDADALDATLAQLFPGRSNQAGAVFFGSGPGDAHRGPFWRPPAFRKQGLDSLGIFNY